MQYLRRDFKQLQEALMVINMRLAQNKIGDSYTLLNNFTDKELTYNVKESIKDIKNALIRQNATEVKNKIKFITPYLDFQLKVISQYAEKRESLKNHHPVAN